MLHTGLKMKNKTEYNRYKNDSKTNSNLSEIIVITSYPPRECGIATYSQDLIKSLNNKFEDSFSIKVCALESGNQGLNYPEEVKFILDTSDPNSYQEIARRINLDKQIGLVLIQHEFGFFQNQEEAFQQFITELQKPIVIVFHSVIPKPIELLKTKVKRITDRCESIIVMTSSSSNILSVDYDVPKEKITVIAHGTHLVPHLSEAFLKEKYDLKNRKVLSTFGLLSSGKSLETTLDALPEIIKVEPDVMFLIMGKTHPEVVKFEGEVYRTMLEEKVKSLNIEYNVRFINRYLGLPELLEYLQLTDIYIFTTNDPNQAVSGTFAYAMSCGCPIISTPIPHAKEVLTSDTGIIFDFKDSRQLAIDVVRLLKDNQLRRNLSTNTLQKIAFTAWENSAVAHARLFEKITKNKLILKYKLPAINLSHVKKLTTDFGMIQFSKINQPDITSGFTLDDNARALIAICMHYKQTRNESDLVYIHTYFNFIKYCQQSQGNFLNYVDKDKKFTAMNHTNLDDANGRAIWALGYLSSLTDIIPAKILAEAGTLVNNSLLHLSTIHSPRAIAFAIKGLFCYNNGFKQSMQEMLIKILADRLVEMYKHESSEGWNWFESYLTYANSILPEALLYAYLVIEDSQYKKIAQASFNFLLSKTFNENGIEVISNRTWHKKGEVAGHFGEQPIDVAYTIMTLSVFYEVFHNDEYLQRLYTAFNWFLGQNRLKQIIYNPCTGGCYDGLEEFNINLNQGAESTLSYLMARLTVENYQYTKGSPNIQLLDLIRTSKKRKESIFYSDFKK